MFRVRRFRGDWALYCGAELLAISNDPIALCGLVLKINHVKGGALA